MKQDITAGIIVHYVQANGAHSTAIITSVADEENNVANLHILRDDAVRENYDMRSVKYSEGLEAGTWHFIEGHKMWKKKDAP
jgi:hypothetical protein